MTIAYVGDGKWRDNGYSIDFNLWLENVLIIDS